MFLLTYCACTPMNLQSFGHDPVPPNFGICHGPGQNYTGPTPQRVAETRGARTCEW